MKIELPARWIKYKEDNKEDKEERKINRLIGNEEEYDLFGEDNVEYIYDPLTIDSEDIRGFNQMDEHHTTIKTYQSDSYVVRINYTLFKAFYTFISGEDIKSIDNFNFEVKKG